MSALPVSKTRKNKLSDDAKGWLMMVGTFGFIALMTMAAVYFGA